MCGEGRMRLSGPGGVALVKGGAGEGERLGMRIGGKRNEPRAWLSARVHETGRSHLHPEYVRRKKVSRIKFEKGANR